MYYIRMTEIQHVFYRFDWRGWYVEHQTGIKHETRVLRTRIEILTAQGNKFAFGAMLH